jgi:hypothetical protein
MSTPIRRIAPFTRIAAFTSLAALAVAASPALATAGGPVKGAKYTGTTAHSSEPISLKVSANGRSVTVSAAFAPLYCEGGGAGTRQITKPAVISTSGAFKGDIAYEFAPEHKITAKLLFSGKFSGHTVKGTARSEFLLAKQCNGSTSFSAKAPA